MSSEADPPRGWVLDHIGIAVTSIGPARLEWLRLGYRVSWEEVVASEGIAVCLMKAEGSAVELLQPLALEGALARFLKSRGPGLHHLGYRVPSLSTSLVDLPWEFIGDVRRGAGGRNVIFAHPSSTGGVLIELVEGESPR